MCVNWTTVTTHVVVVVGKVVVFSVVAPVSDPVPPATGEGAFAVSGVTHGVSTLEAMYFAHSLEKPVGYTVTGQC